MKNAINKDGMYHHGNIQAAIITINIAQIQSPNIIDLF